MQNACSIYEWLCTLTGQLVLDITLTKCLCIRLCLDVAGPTSLYILKHILWKTLGLSTLNTGRKYFHRYWCPAMAALASRRARGFLIWTSRISKSLHFIASKNQEARRFNFFKVPKPKIYSVNRDAGYIYSRILQYNGYTSGM